MSAYNIIVEIQLAKINNFLNFEQAKDNLNLFSKLILSEIVIQKSISNITKVIQKMLETKKLIGFGKRIVIVKKGSLNIIKNTPIFFNNLYSII